MNRGFAPVGSGYSSNIHQSHIRPNEFQKPFHIRSLQIFNDKVTEIRYEHEYRIFFNAKYEERFAMVIFLPPEFPLNSRPIIKIFLATKNDQDIDTTTKLNHPWLDKENSVIGSPGLNTFGTHSELGRVVQAIRREFEKNPPQKTFLLSNNLPTTAAGSVGGATAALNNLKIQMPTYNNPVMVTSTTNQQPQQKTFTEIKELSKEQLKEILDDPVAFSIFYETLDTSVLSSMEQTAVILNDSIKELIATNHELSNKLQEKQKSFLTKSKELMKLGKQLKGTEQCLSDTSRSLTKSSICDKLSIASHDDEHESEKCADEYIGGDGKTLDEFLDTYIEIRKRHHFRKTISEKLNS